LGKKANEMGLKAHRVHDLREIVVEKVQIAIQSHNFPAQLRFYTIQFGPRRRQNSSK